MQSLNSRGDSQKISKLEGGGERTLNPTITSVTQLANEISAVAAEACRNLASGKYSSSRSNSFWLEEELQSQQVPSGKASASASGNWSSSTTSSLFFGKTSTGPMMQNTFDIVGNYFYASPEMAAGACVFNQSVDWWAAGVLLFHMLSGTTPFEGLTKAATLENIERMAVDWDPLPTVSPECRDFLQRILEHGYETRLGSQSPDHVLKHDFFANIDFATLYDGLGPLYPRAPRADVSSPDFYCFSALTDEETFQVPEFAPKAKPEAKELGDAARNSPRGVSPRADVAATGGEDCTDDDPFQDFDYHPF
jgi:serine/threonine protein kinase